MRRFVSWIIQGIAFVGAIWIPVAVGLIAFWILAEPAEMHEIYRSAIEEAGEHLSPILMGIVCLAILSYVLRLITLHFLHLNRPSQDDAPSVKWMCVRSLVSFVITALPWFGILMGMRHTAHASVPGIEAKTNETLLHLSVLVAVLLLVALALALVRMLRAQQPVVLTRRTVWALSAVLLMVILVAASLTVSQVFGPISIVALFLSVASVVLTLGNEAYRIHKIPVVPMFLGLCVVFSYFDLNDNHRLRTITKPQTKDPSQIQFESLEESLLKSKGSFSPDDVFNTWLTDRKDLDAYKKSSKPYPVYVIAAQGGGIYAAYHVAAFLSAIEDRCPTFSQHIFAVSSVSGGSVGSAVFAGAVTARAGQSTDACVSEEATPTPVLANEVDKILQSDFLSPVLSGALFPDLLQQAIPFPIPPFDRARRLESAVEDSWATNSPQAPDFMSKGISRVWALDGAAPGLIFNTTAVDSGRPTVISSFPFPVWKAEPDDLQDLLCKDEDIPVSAAALASARFPWVTPAAWLPNSRCPDTGRDKSKKVPKLRVVDGGYYENSGTEMAENVIQVLKTTQHSPSPFVVKLIVISGATSSATTANSFSELLSPIRTFLSVREERTRRSQRLASNETCNQIINFEVPQFTSYRSCLDFRNYEFPLGWKISSATRTLIKDHLGLTGNCNPPDQLDMSIPPEIRFRMANVCTTMEIIRDLSPTG